MSAGINSTLEDWRTFLTQTLTGALAAPHDLFRKVKTDLNNIHVHMLVFQLGKQSVTEKKQLKSSFFCYSKSWSH